MKKNIYFLIILLCSISFIRVLFTLNEENIHISKNIDIYYYTYNNDESKNVNCDTLNIVGIYDNNTNIIDENMFLMYCIMIHFVD